MLMAAAAAAALPISLSTSPPAEAAETINLLIWQAYIDPSILSDWSARTGIAVHQTYYDSSDARDEVLSNPSSDIDLVVTGENGARLFGDRGILQALSPDTLPSLIEYDESWTKRCGGYGVPYLWGTMGILYRSDAVTTTPTSWADLMKPGEPLRHHIAMFDDHNEAFVPVLVLLGKSINANDETTLREAFQMMKAQAPYVLTYDYVITSIQNPEVGPDVHMALGYSGDQHVLDEMTGKERLWRYAVPSEGTLFWLDCMAISTRSKHTEAALDLLNHIAGAQSAARNAIALQMPTANRAALELIPADMRGNAEIYTAPEILAKSQYQEELSVPSVQSRRRIISSLVQFRDTR